MVKSKPKTVEEILDKLEPEQISVAQKLRLIVKNALPDSSEIIRRGAITYVFNGKDFARLRFTRSHADLGLLIGSKLDDRHVKGTGVGKDVRHVKIVSIKKIDVAEIVRLVKEAAALT